VPGPDLPAGGMIVGLDGIREAYRTGRGKFLTRATAHVESVSPRRKGIVDTELPYTGGLPIWGLVTFVGLALHWPKVLAFRAKQVKRQTFVLSVQSFVLVASLYCAWLLLGIFL